MKHLVVIILAALACAVAVAEDQQPVITRLENVTVFVKDYGEALQWYTERLRFEKTADQAFGDHERWLTVAPAGQKDLQIVLARPKGANAALIGKQALWV